MDESQVAGRWAADVAWGVVRSDRGQGLSPSNPLSTT